MHCDAHTGPEFMEIGSIGKGSSQFLYSHYSAGEEMDLTEVLVQLKENAEAKVGARELREAYRSDFGWPWDRDWEGRR